MEGQRERVKGILSHGIIVQLHIVEEALLIAQMIIMLESVVHRLEPEGASRRPIWNPVKFLSCFELVDELGPPPLGPQKVDVAKVSFGLLSLNIFLLSSGGKRARLRGVPPRPILHNSPY